MRSAAAGGGTPSRGSRWVRAALGVVLCGALPAGAAAPPDHNQLFTGRWFHAPVADDDCTVCHTIHRDPVGPSLQAPVPELCYQCHEDMAAKDVVHEPVGQGRCSDCHRVHTSDHRSLLAKRIPELCIDCHPLDASHVARNTLCTSCHGVHSSETARFLKGERTRNCGHCHQDKRKAEAFHAPAREGKCLTCHFTHPDPRFQTGRLRAAYPSGVFARSGPGVYALCDRCHGPELYTDANASTAFRTATENLHARHVQGPEGIACSACHDVHGKQSVTQWVRVPGEEPRPMQFLRFGAGEGGSCGPSCHAGATYLRDDRAELVEENP